MVDRFQELRAFVAVVEAGGFSAAARKMGDAQPAISKAVGALERRLGVLLLNRSTRTVSLTDQGQDFYNRMSRLLEEMEEAESQLASSATQVSGLVRIAASATFGRLHVLPLIPTLLSSNPRLRIDLTLSDTVRDMVEDRTDLAIRVGPVDEAGAIVRNLVNTPLVCVGSARYFDRHGMPREPQELVGHNCLRYNNGASSAKWPFVGPQGSFSVPVHGNLSSNSMETIRSGVVAGVGIGLLARVSLVAELRNQDVIPILEEFQTEARNVSLVWPQRRFLSQRVRHVIEFFVTAIPHSVAMPENINV